MSAINTNLQALQGALTLGRNQDLLNRTLVSLSSGSKASSVADDPVGSGVASAMTSQTQRLSAAATNIQNAVSYTQAGDSLLGNLANVLNRMSEVIGAAQDPTASAGEIADDQVVFKGLQDQLRNAIGGTTTEIGGATDVASPLGTFNGTALFAPNPSGYQVVFGAAAGDSMTIPATNLRAGAMLNLIQQDSSGNYTLDVSSASAADLTAATQQVAAGRTTLGAAQVRLDLASSTAQVQGQNLASAVSQITDVDVAAASTQLAKYNVLVQADAAMMAQAHTTSEALLKLLQS